MFCCLKLYFQTGEWLYGEKASGQASWQKDEAETKAIIVFLVYNFHYDTFKLKVSIKKIGSTS